MSINIEELLSKVVDDLIPLTENIERLHRMGYVNNFELAGEQVLCLETRRYVDISDVVVDEVLEYSEKNGALSCVYLFAVHELKYRRKGIFLANESKHTAE